MAMDNTTLHTFLFHCPAALRSVVLLGSWDNFSTPYPLELDVRRGRSFWKGCFTFQDIICDGDLSGLSAKRNGPLKMGGTYWYYYKVDEDEECHNPSEPSTTVCPLLPGQRLNVLDLPSEGHSRTYSDTSDAFTRNPRDRYLTPVPPAPLRPVPSPQLTASPQPYSMAPPSPWAPRSATYPPVKGFLSPNVVRHARSASASPRMPSTPVFVDFKVLKDKLASKRSATRNRSGSKSKELEIGSPVLISTTNEELNLIPLSVYQPPPTSSPRSTPSTTTTITTTPTARPVPTIRKEFSPLASHPVDPENDPVFSFAKPPAHEERAIKRRRSHVPSTVITSEFKLGQGRIRANSADTRRTRHYLFSNDPWLQSPKMPQFASIESQFVADDTPSAPVLSRPSSFLPIPANTSRPTSSHSHDISPRLRQTPIDKELPELPRYLTPAPLFACNSTTSSPVLASPPLAEVEEELPSEDDAECLDAFGIQFTEKSRSHFSTWSSDSCPTLDDSDHAASETEDDSPQRPDARFSYSFTPRGSPHAYLAHAEEVEEEEEEDTHPTPTILEPSPEEDRNTPCLSASPPQLDDLRISTFGTDLFNLDIQHADAAPRRQAACYGLGFYSLPEVEATSKSTVCAQQETETMGVGVNVQRESAVSTLTRLVDDFGFLGEAVI